MLIAFLFLATLLGVAILPSCAPLSERLGAVGSVLGETAGDLTLAVRRGEHEVAAVQLPDSCAVLISSALKYYATPIRERPKNGLVETIDGMVDVALCRRDLYAAAGKGELFVGEMKLSVSEVDLIIEPVDGSAIPYAVGAQ